MAKQKQVQIINAIERQPDIIRVAPYVRVSSMSDDQLHSFYVQYNYYYDLVTSKSNWQLVDVYADEGLTGTRADKRDDFNRLIADCHAGEIDRVIVKSVSRFARNVVDCLKYIRELKEAGVTVYFEEEGIDTAQMTDEMILSIRGVQAQYESVVNSKSARWSYMKRMQAGEFITSHAPIGYILHKKMLTIDEKTAPIVRRIFAEYLNGKGVQKIAFELNAEGISTGEDCKWSSEAVTRVLKNEKYTGNALLQKTYTTTMLPFVQKKNRGEMPQYYVEASHGPIISYEDYQRVQELFQWRQQFYISKNKREIYPLSKKLKCSQCGSTFRRKVLKKGGIIWECIKHNLSKELCPVVNVKEQEVYIAFITLYNRLKKKQNQILLPMYKYLERLYAPKREAEREIAELNAEIGKTAKSLTRMSSLFDKGVLSETLYIKNKKPLEQKLYEDRKKRRKLLHQDAAERLNDIEKLIRIIRTGPEVLTEFNAFLFINMVEEISVSENNNLKFRLTGGLTLEEKIERRMRK